MLVWTCEFCDKPIGDDSGALFVDDHEIEGHQAAMVAWEAEALANSTMPELGVISAATLLNYPVVHWQRLHYNCDPAKHRASYWIDVSKIRTAKHVISWSAHLLSKDWLGRTDWEQVLNEVEEQLPD